MQRFARVKDSEGCEYIIPVEKMDEFHAVDQAWQDYINFGEDEDAPYPTGYDELDWCVSVEGELLTFTDWKLE